MGSFRKGRCRYRCSTRDRAGFGEAAAIERCTHRRQRYQSSGERPRWRGHRNVCGDVSEEATAIGTIALSIQRFGSIDILVNNAGRTMNKPLIDMSAADWDAIMAINARGNFLHSREAVRAMIGMGGGAIVNVASIVSAVGMKDTAVYAASKGAITQLTKVVAVEYGDRGIRANAVAPGVVETDILEGIVENSKVTLASYGGAHPIGRVAQPIDIAEVIAFLASPASSFITGALVMADGGYTAL
ncbi:SDR family oxidoreductase [Rhizobium sp.]|uniref:SDR family NAD(P)-dependent oxidoreductase n=1 Tax=Rhizobium sp. TaxID=391 RepID=UPI0028A1EDF2